MAYPFRTYPTLRFAVVFLLCCTGGNGLVVKTSVGKDVVLQCEVEPTTDATDVHWARTDSPHDVDDYVHFRRDGRDDMTHQTSSYNGRTSLFNDELKKGNMSLKLSRVTQADEANYTCTVPEINEFIIQLIVDSVPPAGPFPWWGGVIIGVVVIVQS